MLFCISASTDTCSEHSQQELPGHCACTGGKIQECRSKKQTEQGSWHLPAPSRSPSTSETHLTEKLSLKHQVMLRRQNQVLPFIRISLLLCFPLDCLGGNARTSLVRHHSSLVWKLGLLNKLQDWLERISTGRQIQAYQTYSGFQSHLQAPF